MLPFFVGLFSLMESLQGPECTQGKIRGKSGQLLQYSFLI